jgi:hypothetical protein
MRQQRIVNSVNNRNGGCPLYFNLCFPKQTFSLTKKISKPLSARLSSRAFFCPRFAYSWARLVRRRGVVRIVPLGRRRNAPVFDHVTACVHRRRQQVLPVITVPHRIEIENRRRIAGPGGLIGYRLGMRMSEPGEQTADFIEQHGNLLKHIATTAFHHAIANALQQLGQTLTERWILLHPFGITLQFFPLPDFDKFA